jgi:hypothetical protein
MLGTNRSCQLAAGIFVLLISAHLLVGYAIGNESPLWFNLTVALQHALAAIMIHLAIGGGIAAASLWYRCGRAAAVFFAAASFFEIYGRFLQARWALRDTYGLSWFMIGAILASSLAVLASLMALRGAFWRRG